jgi:hypothetical protein
MELDAIPEKYHPLFADEYLDDRHTFAALAQNPKDLEATPEYLNVLYGQFGQRWKEFVILILSHAWGMAASGPGTLISATTRGSRSRRYWLSTRGDISMFDDAEFVGWQPNEETVSGFYG